ncbi:unnamed protein product, partial [Rotaria sp. Silwood1]
YFIAIKQINQLLWYNDSIDTGYFLAYTGGQGEKAIFTDALYGQVLAFTYGLGPLYSISIMKKHLESEVRLADTPYGLRMLTKREPLTNPQDNSIWMSASQDWSVLNLWFNIDLDSALIQSKKASDGYGIGGKPWVTSLYGFHMVLWHLPFAITGQYTDLTKGILLFSPKLQSPFLLPVLIPNTFGSISATPLLNGQSSYTFTLAIGNLSLNILAINNVKYPGSIHLTAGQSVQWIG